MNNEGKTLSNVAKDPEVLVVLKKWGIISGSLSNLGTFVVHRILLGVENGFDAEEYKNNGESDED